MPKSKRRRCYFFLIPTALAAFACVVPAAQADSISFTPASSALTTTSGGTVTFDGTVTNNSGADLNASDFFLNFFGFDGASVTPNQDLGLGPDFSIPNGTTSASVALFDVLVGAVAPGSSFPIDVQLEDINGDLGAIETVTVSVPAPPPVPEPSSLLLFVAGVVGLLAARRRQNTARSL